MKKAVWFAAISVSSFTLLASIPVGHTVSQLWKPEVAHAAKVTAHLFKSKSLNPIRLARQSRFSQTPNLPVNYTIAKTGVLSRTTASDGVSTVESHLDNSRLALQEFKPSLSSSKMTD